MLPNYELLLLNVSRNKRALSDYFGDSIGQHIIAEYIKRFGFVAKVYSGYVGDAKKVIKFEISEHNVPVIGFYCAADNIVTTLNLIKWIKKIYTDKKIVIGGPQAVAIDKKMFLENSIDYVIVGEGEIPMLKLMECIIDGYGELQEIPSLKYVKNNQMFINDIKGAIIHNLDNIPFPNFDNSLNSNFRKGKTIGLITGRGCPFNCAFCYEGANAKNVRYRSIDNVMKEIDYVRKHNSNLKIINIYDDTFTINRERLKKFCEGMKKRGLLWYCEGHVSYLNKNLDVLPMMKDGGLIGIQLGIESGSLKVLDKYNKCITPQEIISVVRSIKTAGINAICGNLIIGGAGESYDTLMETKEFGKKLIQAGRGILELSTVYFAPYPQTDMVLHPQNYEIEILKEAKDNCIETMRTVVIETAELSSEDIWRIKKEIDAEFEYEYIEQAKKITKDELLQGIIVNNMNADTNHTWKQAYSKIEHLSIFMEHLTVEEQEYSNEKYMLRSFNDYLYSEDSIKTNDLLFCGLEARVLFLANGKNTCKDIATRLMLDLNELEEIYKKLNQQCVVYLSEF